MRHLCKMLFILIFYIGMKKKKYIYIYTHIVVCYHLFLIIYSNEIYQGLRFQCGLAEAMFMDRRLCASEERALLT